MCTDPGKINSVIVLSGDHKQLDAVIKSKHASSLGFKQSYMEYLQRTFPCYQRKDTTNEYDSKYIVQLTNNYRSHRDILYVANLLFYENRLVAKAKEGKTKHISIIHSIKFNFICF